MDTFRSFLIFVLGNTNTKMNNLHNNDQGFHGPFYLALFMFT